MIYIVAPRWEVAESAARERDLRSREWRRLTERNGEGIRFLPGDEILVVDDGSLWDRQAIRGLIRRNCAKSRFPLPEWAA